MATRRRTTTRRTTTRRRTTRSRTTYRRRRPKLATTLGSAVALALIAGFMKLTLWWRVGLVAVVIALAVAWFLWSRRGDIYDEYQADRAENADDAESGQQ